MLIYNNECTHYGVEYQASGQPQFEVNDKDYCPECSTVLIL